MPPKKNKKPSNPKSPKDVKKNKKAASEKAKEDADLKFLEEQITNNLRIKRAQFFKDMDDWNPTGIAEKNRTCIDELKDDVERLRKLWEKDRGPDYPEMEDCEKTRERLRASIEKSKKDNKSTDYKLKKERQKAEGDNVIEKKRSVSDLADNRAISHANGSSLKQSKFFSDMNDMINFVESLPFKGQREDVSEWKIRINLLEHKQGGPDDDEIAQLVEEAVTYRAGQIPEIEDFIIDFEMTDPWVKNDIGWLELHKELMDLKAHPNHELSAFLACIHRIGKAVVHSNSFKEEGRGEILFTELEHFLRSFQAGYSGAKQDGQYLSVAKERNRLRLQNKNTPGFSVEIISLWRKAEEVVDRLSGEWADETAKRLDEIEVYCRDATVRAELRRLRKEFDRLRGERDPAIRVWILRAKEATRRAWAVRIRTSLPSIYTGYIYTKNFYACHCQETGRTLRFPDFGEQLDLDRGEIRDPAPSLPFLRPITLFQGIHVEADFCYESYNHIVLCIWCRKKCFAPTKCEWCKDKSNEQEIQMTALSRALHELDTQRDDVADIKHQRFQCTACMEASRPLLSHNSKSHDPDRTLYRRPVMSLKSQYPCGHNKPQTSQRHMIDFGLAAQRIPRQKRRGYVMQRTHIHDKALLPTPGNLLKGMHLDAELAYMEDEYKNPCRTCMYNIKSHLKHGCSGGECVKDILSMFLEKKDDWLKERSAQVARRNMHYGWRRRLDLEE